MKKFALIVVLAGCGVGTSEPGFDGVCIDARTLLQKDGTKRDCPGPQGCVNVNVLDGAIICDQQAH